MPSRTPERGLAVNIQSFPSNQFPSPRVALVFLFLLVSFLSRGQAITLEATRAREKNNRGLSQLFREMNSSARIEGRSERKKKEEKESSSFWKGFGNQRTREQLLLESFLEIRVWDAWGKSSTAILEASMIYIRCKSFDGKASKFDGFRYEIIEKYCEVLEWRFVLGKQFFFVLYYFVSNS